MKHVDSDKLDFNLFEFTLKIAPFYFATGEVEESLSGLWAEIAYLKTETFLQYIKPMDSATRMKTLLQPWWWEIPKDSLIFKIEDEAVKKDLEYAFKVSG